MMHTFIFEWLGIAYAAFKYHLSGLIHPTIFSVSLLTFLSDNSSINEETKRSFLLCLVVDNKSCKPVDRFCISGFPAFTNSVLVAKISVDNIK